MTIYEVATGQPVEFAERPRWPLSTGQLVQTADGPRRVLAITCVTVAAPGVEQVFRVTLGGIVDPFGPCMLRRRDIVRMLDDPSLRCKLCDNSVCWPHWPEVDRCKVEQAPAVETC